MDEEKQRQIASKGGQSSYGRDRGSDSGIGKEAILKAFIKDRVLRVVAHLSNTQELAVRAIKIDDI